MDCASGRSIQFEELDQQAAEWAGRLESLGLEPGERVAVKMTNCPEFVASFLATLRLRLVMVPVDSKLGDRETNDAVRYVGAKVLLTQSSIQEVKANDETEVLPSPPPEDTALIKLTSGSTGTPKGVALTDAQLIADANNICSTMDIRPDDLNFAVIALSHSYGFDNLVVPLITQGTPMVVLDEMLPRAILEGIASTRATVFPAVPFLLETLGQLPPPIPDVISLRVVISAGAPLQAETYRKFRERFGIKVHQFYGSSECGGITYERNPPEDFIPGCVGTPLDNVIVDMVQEGRVRVRGANVASGYFPTPAPDEERVLGGGVFLTGDLGQFDERGRLHLQGRIANFINVAGKKVNSSEIEECIQQFPAVKDAAVIGIADLNRHESVTAFVVTRPGATIKTEYLLRHCRAHLASWKVPRRVEFLDALPLSAVGKLDRAALKKRIEQQG